MIHPRQHSTYLEKLCVSIHAPLFLAIFILGLEIRTVNVFYIAPFYGKVARVAAARYRL